MKRKVVAAAIALAMGGVGWMLVSGGETGVSATGGISTVRAGTVTYSRSLATSPEGAVVAGVTPIDPTVTLDNLTFHAITPCRVIDTRLTAAGELNANKSRAFLLANPGSDFGDQGGSDTNCDVPSAAVAVQVNVTSAEASGNGNIRVYPYGEAAPTASLVNFRTGIPIANAAPVLLCRTEDGDACASDVRFLATADTHLVVDVMGYFEPPMRVRVLYDGRVVETSPRVSTVTVETVGYVRVTFDRDVSECGYVTSLSGWQLAGPDSGSVGATAFPFDPSGASVAVFTYDADGIAAERTFDLQVNC